MSSTLFSINLHKDAYRHGGRNIGFWMKEAEKNRNDNRNVFM